MKDTELDWDEIERDFLVAAGWTNSNERRGAVKESVKNLKAAIEKLYIKREDVVKALGPEVSMEGVGSAIDNAHRIAHNQLRKSIKEKLNL